MRVVTYSNNARLSSYSKYDGCSHDTNSAAKVAWLRMKSKITRVEALHLREGFVPQMVVVCSPDESTMRLLLGICCYRHSSDSYVAVEDTNPLRQDQVSTTIYMNRHATAEDI